MTTESEVMEPTADELRVRLEEIEAEMRTLSTKRETLTERASEKAAAAAELRREITQLQLGDAPDERAMKATRAQLLDCEADASTARDAAAAIKRTIEELSREHRETECSIAIAEYAAAEQTMIEANDVLADAIAQIQGLLEEPLATLKRATEACATVSVIVWDGVQGHERARRRIPHPENEAPFLWRGTLWQQAETILATVAACQVSRSAAS
jgi:chromosome segregation ATPase